MKGRDWLKAIGDNEYVAKEESKDVRAELGKRTKKAVKDCLLAFSSLDAGGELSVGETIKLSSVLESLFCFGLKSGMSYWAFLKEGLLKQAADMPVVARDVFSKVVEVFSMCFVFFFKSLFPRSKRGLKRPTWVADDGS